jgi:leucyl/phenylalanyl-tRNA--protein transferase
LNIHHSIFASRFPDPRSARGDVIAVGDDLRVATLHDAYRHGIFPWPTEGMPLPWFSPRRRTVIFFEELRLGRSLRKAMKRDRFQFTIDRAFRSVVESCAAMPRPEQGGTWIGPEIVDAYTRFHESGEAHSVEAWEGDVLAGGLYGVDSGGVFTGESMFYRVPDASRLALLFLIDHLRIRGGTWLDCQIMTPHMRILGAREIARSRFLDLLGEAQAKGLSLF